MQIRFYRSQKDATWFAAAELEREPPRIEISLVFGPPVDRAAERLPPYLAPWRPVDGHSVPTMAGEAENARHERVSQAIKAEGYFLFRSATRSR